MVNDRFDITFFKSLDVSVQERDLLHKLHGQHGYMVETVQAWSRQNSGSYNKSGLSAMRAILADSFKVLPAVQSEYKLPQGEAVALSGEIAPIDYEPSLLITVRPDAPLQLVMTGHYDTVFPKDSHFQTPVFLDENTLNGPGTADMKGGILVMLEALKAFEQSENAARVGYNILLSPDEEIGSPGSSKPLAELGRKAHLGLTYEPALADGSLAGARKGSGNFTFIIRGKAAHAGREHDLGRNAINAMAEAALRLNDLNGQREGVTFNMAKIDGGGAVNIVPDLAIGRFNVRVQETEDMPWVLARLDDIMANINNRDGLDAELKGKFTRPPKPMAPANRQVFEWVKAAGAALGQDIKWSPSGGVCEGNNLWASGCPNVDTLGVRGGRIHSDEEFMLIDSLVERAQLSALILMKIASGEFDAKSVKAMAIVDHHGEV